MDKDNDKLADYFNQAMNEEETPSFIWDNIAQNIDHADMSVLKEGFQDFYAYKEPNINTWDNIQKILNDAPADIMTDAFNEFYATEEPNSQVWENIQDKVDITNTWGRIQKKLDSKEKWKLRFQRFGAVAMLLLLLHTCIGEGYIPQPLSNLFEETKTNPVEVLTLSNHQQNSTNNKASSNNNSISNTNKSPVIQELNGNTIAKKENNDVIKNHSKEENKSIPTTTVITKKNENSTTIDPNQKSIAKKENNDVIKSPSKEENKSIPATTIITKKNKTSTTIDPNKKSIAKKENNDVIKDPTKEENKNVPATTVITKKNENSTTIAPNQKSIAKKENKNIPVTEVTNTTALKEIETTENTPYKENNNSNHSDQIYNLQLLPSITIDSIEETPIQLPLAETISFSLENFSKKKNKKFPKFELGLIGKIGTSFLLNEMTREGLRYSSIQDTRLEFTGNIGFILGVKITPKDALTLQVAPYAPTTQNFSYFSNEGVFSQNEIKLSYLDFALGYERDWLVFEIGNQNKGSVFTRLDIGLSHLVQEQVLLNTETVQQQTFKKWNISVGLALGSKYQFNKFVLDYGICGSIGVNDINNNTHLGSQPTNLATFGGFIGLRYQLQ